jgi:hypothetical protein
VDVEVAPCYSGSFAVDSVAYGSWTWCQLRFRDADSI